LRPEIKFDEGEVKAMRFEIADEDNMKLLKPKMRMKYF